MRKLISAIIYFTVSMISRIDGASAGACDTMKAAEVEQLIKKQHLEASEISGPKCTGLCDSQNISFCIYRVPHAAEDAVFVRIRRPPFNPGDWFRIYGASYSPAPIKTEVEGIPALWTFEVDYKRSLLEVFDGNRIHFVVGREGVNDGGLSLRQSKEIASIILSRTK